MSNNQNFEDLMRKIQKKINQDEEKIYSKTVIDEYKNPSNFGILKKPDAHAQIKGPCGDTMKFELKVKDDKISDIRFWTDGCGATIACGSMLTKLIKGKNINFANNFSSSKLVNALGGLPPENHHCSVLAIDTLHLCIKNLNKKIGRENEINI